MMGVVVSILRMCVVEALRGNTLAGASVLDSSIEALADVMEKAEQRPVIVVRIDEGSAAEAGAGFFATSTKLTLSLDLIVASLVTHHVPNEEGAPTPVTEVVIQATDPGLEFSLDILDRQWRTVLSDPENAFSQAFLSVAGTVGTLKWVRASAPESGRKFAVRMVEVDLEPLFEPSPGQALPVSIDAALTLLAGKPDRVGAVSIMRAELAQSADLYSWQKVQAMLATTSSVPGMLGVAPPDNDEAVLTDDIVVGVNGTPAPEVSP